MQKPVHIVTRLNGIGGAETHSFELTNALNRDGIPARLWSSTASDFVSYFNGTAISPYNGVFPKGGTLIIVGTYFGVDPWIDHVRPERLIVICVNSDPRQLYAMLAILDRPSLPPVEMAYVSTRLCATMGITGYICPEIVDLDRFQARKTRGVNPFTIGRLSRDIPEKHHPQDPSLYRMLGWHGTRTRIMGGACLGPELNGESCVELLAMNAEKPEDFLLTLDVFYYRTHPSLHESSGRVVIEAMACGLPIVAHKSGGYTDWITPGENGYIFSTQEEAFQTLNILKNDADLLQKLSSGARESAEKIAGPEACRAYFSWLTGTGA